MRIEIINKDHGQKVKLTNYAMQKVKITKKLTWRCLINANYRATFNGC